jgi:hypothetical protein
MTVSGLQPYLYDAWLLPLARPIQLHASLRPVQFTASDLLASGPVHYVCAAQAIEQVRAVICEVSAIARTVAASSTSKNRR